MPSQQKERRERSPNSWGIRADGDEGEIHAGAQEIGRAKGSILKRQTSPIERRTRVRVPARRPVIVFAGDARAKRRVFDSK